MDEQIEQHNFFSLKLLWRAIIEQKQILSTSSVVKIGRGTTIHPSAIITGPAVIGDNCNIGPGAIIDNCTIGDNVSIDSGCVVSLSTVGNNCFLPFRSSLYLTALMDSTIVAQNTCLQMCVIGRNSFHWRGQYLYRLQFDRSGRARRARARTADRAAPHWGRSTPRWRSRTPGRQCWGGAVGHNCRLGSGLIVFPGRMVESDTIMFASPQRRVVSRSVTFEESDHHYVRGGAEAHRRMYPRPGERVEESIDESWDEW
jgi:NDP-sugar pyrophosphorylase family protein